MLVGMNKIVLTAIAAVALGITASPADAKSLGSGDHDADPIGSCARIVMSDESGDCSVQVECRRVKMKRIHRPGFRKVRMCLVQGSW